MYRNALAGGVATLMACLTTGTLAAQVPGSTVRVTPVVGWYAPTQNLGAVPEGDEASILRTEASVMLGASVEAPVAGTPFGVRGQILFAPGSGLSARRFQGFEPCGTNCDRAVYTSDPLASGSVLIGVVDAVVRTPRIGSVRPYAVLGGGLRRYDFDRDALNPQLAQSLSGDDTRFVAHVGVGFTAPAGPVEIAAEAGDFLGRYTVGDPAGETWSDDMQHDFGITLGLRWSLR